VQISLVMLLLALNSQALPPDVEAECDDHVAALRTIKGHDVVFSCEDNVWLSWSQWANYGETTPAH